jgi:antitoxin YefM
MAIEITYTQARDHLASFMDQAVDDREVIRIHRKSREGINRDVVIIAADELEGLLETAYLLRSPKNAERLLAALTRAQAQTGGTAISISIEDLERQMNMGAPTTSP